MSLPRLLFLTERFPPDMGGVARSAGRIVTSIQSLGIAVDVVTWSRYLQPGEVSAEQVGSGRVYRLGLYRHWDATMPHTLNILDGLHQASPFEAVWGHYLFPAGFLGVWFGRQHQIPTLVSARGNDIDRELFPPGDFARLQWTLTHASTLTAVSHDMARKMQMVSDRTPITVLPNTLDCEIFHPLPPHDLQDLRHNLGIVDQEVVLGFSGELREKKGQGFLLQALAQLRAQRPVCLLIIGELRSAAQSLLQTFAIDHPDHAARVIVTGQLSDPEVIVQHLNLCDIYLQPSLWEGMPNALLEAMACERCCIASDAGGIPEVLESGHTGWVIPRSQLHHLGDAILDCLSLSVEERRQMGQRARQFVQTHHAPSQEKVQLQQLLQQIV
ncbi:glycosyltransferase [Acaryochloris marina]|uniref:Glycosyl transferase, group 1 n=1 Tax=Acaryochloris marina (strain MBIC 11017) TaxID=329726 RepID=B0C485_ACAM1|nr:glycosyl transferase, group 1 [Acaryochloris marina MBIC11017]BDM82212.1 glycosyl transferase [Acaryochloris marina MBIC10699]